MVQTSMEHLENYALQPDYKLCPTMKSGNRFFNIFPKQTTSSGPNMEAGGYVPH